MSLELFTSLAQILNRFMEIHEDWPENFGIDLVKKNGKEKKKETKTAFAEAYVMFKHFGPNVFEVGSDDLDDYRESPDFPDQRKSKATMLSRWLNEEYAKRVDTTLKDIAQFTQIPYEVLVNVRCGLPVLYDIKTRRYSFNPYDSNFVNQKIIQDNLIKGTNSNYLHPYRNSVVSINEDRHLDDIERWLQSIVKSVYAQPPFGAIKKAIEEWPDLNLIVRNCIEQQCGHIILFPISMDTYEQLRTWKIREYELKNEHVISARSFPKEPVCFYLYSLFGVHAVYIYTLLLKVINFAAGRIHDVRLGPEWKQHKIARCVTTEKGIELCFKLGMKALPDRDRRDEVEYRTQIPPRFWEETLGDMGKIEGKGLLERAVYNLD